MHVFLPDNDATEALGQALARTRPAAAVVHLQGDLGAGKSTLARALLRTLGVAGAIRSPTYTLVERYPVEGGEAWHLDLYRIGDAGELDVCYLGGMQFDSVCVYVQNSAVDLTATVKNHIGIGMAQKTWLSTVTTYSRIVIDDGKIIIEVPANRIINMITYLQAPQTYKNLILIVNGYRPIINGNGDPFSIVKIEYNNSNNQIEYGDSRGYWKGIDAQFMNRIGTRQEVYADGHHSVATSNHFSTAKYGDGNLKSLLIKLECDKNPFHGICKMCGSEFLHTNPLNT